jgi:hypothetical protein
MENAQYYQYAVISYEGYPSDRKIPYPISAKWLTRLLDRVGHFAESFALKAYSHAAGSAD